MELVPDRAKWQLSCSRLPNVLTLSCKKPLSARGSPRQGGCCELRNSAGATGSRHAAVQLEPPEAAPPPGQRSGGFLSACEGSWAAYLAEVMIQAFVAALTTELRRCNPQHATLLNGQVHLARRCSCGQ